jgi:hypothetical protein
MSLANEDFADIPSSQTQHATAAPIIAVRCALRPAGACAPDEGEIKATAADDLPKAPSGRMTGVPLRGALGPARLRRVEPDEAHELTTDPDRVAVHDRDSAALDRRGSCG